MKKPSDLQPLRAAECWERFVPDQARDTECLNDNPSSVMSLRGVRKEHRSNLLAFQEIAPALNASQ
ncbi:hypothetical protein A2V82_11080 [candidate division KSB1 bacterium RBG_16_48_16]|nr:MAG: hypothetical protein A2V82_11080 [candidate division KSB1 bacterium RBG_16_48_16]